MSESSFEVGCPLIYTDTLVMEVFLLLPLRHSESRDTVHMAISKQVSVDERTMWIFLGEE